MSIRHWPLSGSLEVFYSGGFGSTDEDLRRLLRQVARWSEHEQDKATTIEAISVTHAPELVEDDEPTTWAAYVWLVAGEGA